MSQPRLFFGSILGLTSGFFSANSFNYAWTLSLISFFKSVDFSTKSRYCGVVVWWLISILLITLSMLLSRVLLSSFLLRISIIICLGLSFKFSRLEYNLLPFRSYSLISLNSLCLYRKSKLSGSCLTTRSWASLVVALAVLGDKLNWSS